VSKGRKVIPSPGGILPGGVIYEQVRVDDSHQFAVKKGVAVSVEPFLELGEYVAYQPVVPCPWRPPPAPKPYGSPEALWREVREFAYEHIDFERDVQYDILTAWVLASWIPECFDTASYLWFTGPSNSGKSRSLDVLAALGFRPLLSPSVSAASIFRALDAYHPTFLLDEFEIYTKVAELKAEVIGVLNAGYRRGQVVLRVEKVRDEAPVLKGFDVFGPKAIGSIAELPATLIGRTIPFTMSRATRNVRRKVDWNWGDEVRSKLLMYRLEHVGDEFNINPLNLQDGRLIELYTPLISVAPTDELKRLLEEYAEGQFRSMTERERESEEALVFTALVELLAENPRDRIPQAEVRERANINLSEEERLGKKRVAAILRRLGFESVQNRKTRLMEVVISPQVVERRAARYLSAEEAEKLRETLAKLPTLKPAEERPSLADDERRLVAFIQKERAASKDWTMERLGWQRDRLERVLTVAVKDGLLWVGPDGIIRPM
jgi:energy-coupling factor transporter ATP-binding protein EcfA2